MIAVENINVTGWEAAIRGMRNPLESWEKSDSQFDEGGSFSLGQNDLELMQKLCAAGSDHRKFMRMIIVTMDVTAPLFWWKEADTYKVGTVLNSCSTMHTIHKRDLTVRDFSAETILGDDVFSDLHEFPPSDETEYAFLLALDEINANRMRYIKTGDTTYWRKMIELLPSSYNQRRTWQFSYENAWNIYHARKKHKLEEWQAFCDALRSELPYFRSFLRKKRKNKMSTYLK